MKPPRPRPARAWLARLEHAPVRLARPIRWGALAVALGSALLLPRARFDSNPINLRDPEADSVRAFRDLVARTEVTPWSIDVTMPDLRSARELADRLDRLRAGEARHHAGRLRPRGPGREARDPAGGGVPAASELGASTARPTLPRSLRPSPPSRPSSRARTAPHRRRCAPARSVWPARSAASRLRPAARTEPCWHACRRTWSGTLPKQLADLTVALAPERVTLESLPPELRDQMLAADGRARIQIFPRKDVFDGAALDEFMDAVTAVAPNVSGPAVDLVGWGRVTSGAMTQALSVGLICMFAFLFLLWRSVWDSLLAFFPLALASVASVAVMVLVGMPFNFANVIVLPMLIGMGIDNGVHLVHRHRADPKEGDLLGTSTARAVFFSALTTVLCFGSLGFASHRGMAAVGKLLTLGVAATLAELRRRAPCGPGL